MLSVSDVVAPKSVIDVLALINYGFGRCLINHAAETDFRVCQDQGVQDIENDQHQPAYLGPLYAKGSL